MDIVERLRNFETTNVDLLFLKNDAALEIERLREALRNVLSVQPIKGDEGSTDIIALAKALLEIDSIARAALKEKE